MQAAVGRIGSRPTSDETQFQFSVQTQGRLSTPDQFGQIVIRANPDGSVLRLSDLARVELGAQNMDTESRLNGNPAVSIGLYLAPGANAVQTSARVKATLDDLSKRFPEGLKARVFYDSSTFVTATIENGMMIPTEDANSYVMQVSAADTLEFPLGNGRFDFEVWFPGDIVRRYVAGAFVQVNPEVGAA